MKAYSMLSYLCSFQIKNTEMILTASHYPAQICINPFHIHNFFVCNFIDPFLEKKGQGIYHFHRFKKKLELTEEL